MDVLSPGTTDRCRRIIWTQYMLNIMQILTQSDHTFPTYYSLCMLCFFSICYSLFSYHLTHYTHVFQSYSFVSFPFWHISSIDSFSKWLCITSASSLREDCYLINSSIYSLKNSISSQSLKKMSHFSHTIKSHSIITALKLCFWQAFFQSHCCNSTQLAAQHHPAVCSVPPSGMEERIEEKGKIHRTRRHNRTEKERKIILYIKQAIHNTIAHHLPTDAQTVPEQQPSPAL